MMSSPAPRQDGNDDTSNSPSSKDQSAQHTSSSTTPSAQPGKDDTSVQVTELSNMEQPTETEVQKERTAFAVAHSVGIDGALNPLLADGLSIGSKLSKEDEPVMRKQDSEPIGKRIVEEVKEIGGVVKEAIEKVVHGRRASSEKKTENDESKGSNGGK